jgi:C_GCAxxG_C_C family probable redox protein
MDAESRSVQLFDQGLYCAESVLLAMAESHGIDSDWIPRIASGFCSGVAGTDGMCGALSGAIMGIGLAAGRMSERESLDACYARVRSLLEEFESRFGSIRCADLTGCHLGTPEGQERFQQLGVGQKCRGFVETATAMASELSAPDWARSQ